MHSKYLLKISNLYDYFYFVIKCILLYLHYYEANSLITLLYSKSNIQDYILQGYSTNERHYNSVHNLNVLLLVFPLTFQIFKITIL